jgi:two-component sensor histidine kinase
LQASIATPLAVVITELLQNAAEHGWPEGPAGDGSGSGGSGSGGFGGGSGGGGSGIVGADGAQDGRVLHVDVELFRTDAELRVTVRDDGVGLPPGFSVDDTSSLGLSIVRNLVGTQMGGTITMRNDRGTVVDVVIPVDHPTDDLENL